MSQKISLRTAGIIAGIGAVCAFLFGIIITTSLPTVVNRSEAHAELSATSLYDGGDESPFVRVATIVSPAVVNISAEKKISRDLSEFDFPFGGPFDEFFRDFFRDWPKTEQKTHTLGSGVIVSEDGYIVTNYHVIKGAVEAGIIIRLIDKQEFKGDEIEIVGTDSHTDLALLKVKASGSLPALTFGNSDEVKVGDWAIAVGNPFQLEGTVTVGVISAKGRSNIPLPEGPDLQSFLQTDAAINPGNSGGPLVNIHGEIIGINSAITSTTGGNMGIGFAIPANIAKDVIEKLKTHGKVTRGYLGVYLQDITSDLKEALDLPSLAGVLISEVVDDTPADRAGIKGGDVVVAFGDHKVEDVQSFRVMVAATPAGASVPLKVFRDGREKILTVKIGEYPEDVSAGPGEDEQRALGLRVVSAADPQAQRFNLDIESGIVVIDVVPDTPAARAGIRAGDVILKIDKNNLNTVNDYKEAIARMQKGEPVGFQLLRSGRKVYVAVTP